MSRRSRARRKQVRLTIRDTRATPRAVHTGDARTRSYPGVHELLAASSGAAWRDWLETTLRGVLRPAAIVSAVGLAAGCGGGAQTGAAITTDTTTVQSSSTTTPPVTTTGATLVPMPNTGSGVVISGKLPPGQLHGTPVVVPIPDSVAVRGEAVAVDPTTLPTPDPVPLGGAPMPMQIDPPPEPQPAQQHPPHPHPQAHPQPDPMPMPGGIAPVMPPPPTQAPQS